MKHHFVHDAQGRILAIVRSSTAPGINGTRHALAPKPTGAQRVTEIELRPEHAALSWKDIVETMIVESGELQPRRK